ncbi:MAG: guanylate kinase, partial [Chloroflexi bacterium]|nr:guanylate kinase [Chloroflexota bacterium]
MKKVTDKSRLPFHQSAKPLLVVLSGPSGVGKDAVLARMKELTSPLQHITTLTTRPRRPNEKNNVDYHFVSLKRFQEMIQKNELLEWANVYGNWYGVPREAVKQALDNGRDIIVKV